MGSERPKWSDADALATKVYALCANGMGGLDWSAVPLQAARYGVDDVEGLLDRLEVIKLHRRPEKED